MKLLNNMSMPKKMITFTFIAVIGLVIIGYIGISNMNAINGNLDVLYNEHMHNIEKIEDTREYYLIYSRDVINHMGARNAEYRAKWEKSMREHDAAGNKALSEYTIVTEEGRQLINQVKAEWADYRCHRTQHGPRYVRRETADEETAGNAEGVKCIQG